METDSICGMDKQELINELVRISNSGLKGAEQMTEAELGYRIREQISEILGTNEEAEVLEELNNITSSLEILDTLDVVAVIKSTLLV